MSEPFWWPSLRHGGLLLSASRLADLFPDPAPPLSSRVIARLRADVLRVADRPDDADAATALLDTVLHEVAGLQDATDARWQRGPQVEPRFARRSITGEVVKPRRVWRGPRGAMLPVFFDDEPRLGIGRGRRAISRVLEWCRGTGHSLALLTNARQFRLCYVAAEHDAWAQWDTSLWFEQGVPSFQVEALCQLLGPRVHIPPADDQPSPLLDAIRASRQGQSKLTSLLGERVRQAVELLIDAHAPHLRTQPDIPRPDIYRAATLVVMRLVVSLFAEARDLFPRSNRIYEASYGLQGLREKLHRAAGGNTARLRSRFGSWPQVLALFRLVYAGSPHDELPLRAYGGELFRPGRADDHEAVRRAMNLFENAALAGDPPAMNDADVLTLLELLTRCAVPVRQGRSVTTVTMPVDFADLSTEYIGILYEGLLDYELNQVPPDSTDPILFLNLGDQPALPLSRLEALEGAALRDFFKEFQKKQGLSTGSEDNAGDDAEADADDDVGDVDAVAAADADAAVEETAPALDAADPAMEAKQRALAWARRAVVEAKLVRAYTGNDPGRRAEAEERIGRAANQLLARPPVLPGEYFLVRWGGTRKGQGSFYTRPGLVEPTVRRTLAPLCYDLPAEPSAEELRDPQSPKPPAAILGLKVADISMGSASFLVSALRYLTDALWRSLLHHRWIVPGAADGAPYVPGPGLPAGEPPWFRECVRDLPMEHAAAENTIRARLKRLIVERCLYGVDLDPLAVELARLSLWIETMDRDLPFGFLDHKLKCGNSLVGCWFDRFRDFPALCLHRPQDDAGDKTHNTGVQSQKGRLSSLQKEFRDSVLKPALAHWIESRDPSVFVFLADGQTPDDLHAIALRLFEEMHTMPLLTEEDVEARAAFYRDRVEPALAPLRGAFDLWCSLWFWPAEQLAHFPLPIQAAGETVRNVFTEPTPEARQIVADLRAGLRFFHWEIEFPDVFTVAGSGFDALLGNPPWEVQKPNSKEFFSNHDPLYRTYGKQEALTRQRELFNVNPRIEQEWLDYVAQFKALSNWCANTAFPWGDPTDTPTGGAKWLLVRSNAGIEMHETWRIRRGARRGYANAEHAFRHQGSADVNSYKLFLEQGQALLALHGRFGLVVPSSVYADKGARPLREVMLDTYKWEWLFAFSNKDQIFDIDSTLKFAVLIAEKNSRTRSVKTAFLRRDLHSWDEAELYFLKYPREQVENLSPISKSFFEIRTDQDLQLLVKLYSQAVVLGNNDSNGWNIQYTTEFHMTSDSRLFPKLPEWEALGYKEDVYGYLVCEGAPAAAPLYVGKMVEQFDHASVRWISGQGRSAIWEETSRREHRPRSPYAMSMSCGPFQGGIGFRDLTNILNRRSMVAAFLPPWPCGNLVPLIRPRAVSTADALFVLGCLNSFCFDYACRTRIVGIHLNWFILEEMPLLPRTKFDIRISLFAARLALAGEVFAEQWLELFRDMPAFGWRKCWAATAYERLRMRAIIDAFALFSYGLNWDEARWLLRDCDRSCSALAAAEFRRTIDPKGFWRVDKGRDPELRHTVLSLVAFHDLQRMGLEAFLAQNDGEGWMLPETLRLADYGLGHDDRAREPRPVASRLGPRFHPWQLEGTVEESWEECRRHAANLRAIRSHDAPAAPPSAAGATDLLGHPIETDLFGQEVMTKKCRKDH